MRIHTTPQRRTTSTISLDNSIDPSLMDTSVPAVFPPAIRRYPYNGLTAAEEYEQGQSQRVQESIGHSSTPMFSVPRPVPTVSERIIGYGRRSNNYDENGIEVQQLANGDLALIGNRLCREDSRISITDPQQGRFARLKKICSFGTLSSGDDGGGGSDSERSNGVSRSQHWMLLITPVVSSFSLALVIAAVVGPQWLLTEEKIPVTTYHNSTHGAGHNTVLTTPATSSSLHNQQLNIQHPHLIPATKDDISGAYLTKYTKSSLWMLCSKYNGGTVSGQQQQQHQVAGDEFQCSSIDYFPSEGYSPDPNDSTNAIPYTVTHSSPFFLASNGVLIVSYGLFLVAMCSTKHKICYFVSGVLFIISGLLMLIGLIMYISILKAEIGSKLRPRSSLQAPQFTFRYGQSFLLYVFGFIITELSGILNVLIYSNVQQDEYSVHDGAGHSAYPTYQNLSGGILYNLHYRREMPTARDDELVKGQEGPPIVDYRYPYDGIDCEPTPRYYFEQQQQQPDDNEIDCRVHRRAFGRETHDGISKSLTDLLYMEPTQAYPDRDASQSRVRTNADGQRTDQPRSPIANLEFSHWSSSTGKLTRSVSTYTDLLPINDFAPDDTRRNRRASSRSPSRSDDDTTTKVGKICGLSRHYLSRELSKEKLFNEFCKKVGPRPKPKDIYYIESDGRNGDSSYRSVYVVEPSSPHAQRNRSSQRRRNSMADTRRASNYHHRIHSDNSLDDLMNDARYNRRRDPMGRARSVDYRQTLPRNFQQRHMATSDLEDETGGFGERLELERKRISASGLLMEPERNNSSHGDLSSDGIIPGRWHKAGEKLQNGLAKDTSRISNTATHCPKYLDPPPPTYTSTLSTSITSAQQQKDDLPPPAGASHTYRSYGDLTTHQQDYRRPTILSPHAFSPINKAATPPALRPLLTVVQQQPPHRHIHHQHHRHHNAGQQQQQLSAEATIFNRNQSLPSPVFDLDRIEQERRKSHSQLFLNSPVAHYDFVNGTAV
ncbi:uncharacterized protein LOC126556943 [Anopheles maculipalpis]|uniref:uncharacterized protein LOC126556943 n=1 Tax=Anopheles maculipalpis TaxID=1496333 RepID=UPI00215912FF|nr:uncharacterized protein LOC126556943 [Anopheles maculipalpis]